MFIGADNRLIGRQAGELMAELLDGKGDIVEIKGCRARRRPAIAARACTRRSPPSRAFTSSTTRLPTGCARKPMTQMEIALAAHDHIDLVYAHNDPMAVGAYLAAKAKGRDREMKFIGIDALPGPDGGRQAVADGKLEATFVYPTGGGEAVETAAKLLAGATVPRHITLASERIARTPAKSR